MKSKSFMLMILSMGFGLIAAIGISQVMGRSKAPIVQGPKMGPVLVAADHLDHNTILTEENVKIENWPVEIIPETAATELEQIQNMAVRSRLSKGLPVMVPDLVHKNEMGGLSIPEGFKVVAIKVAEDDTIAGLLKPGDRVDIIGMFKSRDRHGQSRQYSKTFLKALRVFSVNSQLKAAYGSREETSTRGSAIVGVLVTERQSEAIVYVQKTGQLKLVLRGDEITDDDENNDHLLDFDLPGHETVDNDDEGDSEDHQFGTFENNIKTEGPPSMIVWNGNEASKVTFSQGNLPQTTGTSSASTVSNPIPSDNSAGESSEGEEDPDSFDESDRGLDEDQYPAQ